MGILAVFVLVGATIGLHFSRSVVVSDCEVLLRAIGGVLDADLEIGRSRSRLPRWVPLAAGYSLVSDVSANDLARVHVNDPPTDRVT
jgi:hypothetical protein